MDLSSLLARFPLSALPTPPIPPSPLMEMTPDQPENVWTDPLSNLYGYAAALQASLGIEIDANRDGGIGRFRDVLVVRGVEESSTREIYGAEVGDGAKKTKGEDKEAVGIKVGTHM